MSLVLKYRRKRRSNKQFYEITKRLHKQNTTENKTHLGDG